MAGGTEHSTLNTSLQRLISSFPCQMPATPIYNLQLPSPTPGDSPQSQSDKLLQVTQLVTTLALPVELLD